MIVEMSPLRPFPLPERDEYESFRACEKEREKKKEREREENRETIGRDDKREERERDIISISLSHELRRFWNRNTKRRLNYGFR